jgi:hypothetical protein
VPASTPPPHPTHPPSIVSADPMAVQHSSIESMPKRFNSAAHQALRQIHKPEMAGQTIILASSREASG